MAKICFVERNFRPDSLDKIRTANRIIETYQASGLKLTLRQLYYQFVARHGLPNTERSYKNLASIVSDGRLAGLIDWNAIEDRGRVAARANHYSGIPGLMDAALYSYRLDRWQGQETYAELWVEKQALAGVLEPLADNWHATLMVNKGYSSQSAMYEAAVRYVQAIERNHHEHAVLFYIGDHDPSGEDMVRDIAERLATFGASLEVRKLALTMDQVEQHNPPPNPAKTTDSRFEGYAAKHGDESWEVDALDPETLSDLVNEAFESVVDSDKMDKIKQWEEDDKTSLRKVVKSKFAKINRSLDD